MAVSGYLKIDDIGGESSRSDHEDEIVISGFSWGATRNAYRNSGGQRESGLPEVHGVSITKDYDKSSPYLALACMTNTLIESYTTGAGGTNPVDNLALSFDTIKIKYIEDAGDLTAGDEHEIEYDILAAK